MPYELVKIGEFSHKKVFVALKSLGYNIKQAQRLCDKGRLQNSSGALLAKNDIIDGELFMIDYVCEPRGLKPIFECDDFAVFDKPSGLLSHPSGRKSPYNMYDEIWHLYGKQACVAHRLDAQTSGLLLVAKSPQATTKLKELFENRAVFKSYLAYVKGDFCADILVERGDLRKFTKSSLDSEIFREFKQKFEFIKDFKGYFIDKAMKLGGYATALKQKMVIADDGKRALTLIRVLKSAKELNCNASLLECLPLTGRQHQIRLHLFHIKHCILGEPLYGLSKEQTGDLIDNKLSLQERINLTGATRLMLHANELKFIYKSQKYEIKSQTNFNFLSSEIL